MAEQVQGPGDHDLFTAQAKEGVVEVRTIEPEVAAAELQQQVDLIKEELVALDKAKSVPQSVLEVVVSI